MAMTIVEAARPITGGVDTHGDVHMAAALDAVGGLLGTQSFPATPLGYRALVAWLESFGAVGRVGVEGTGAYGAGLARSLARAGIEVLEVDRPNRQARRRQGKSDAIDAIEAARTVLAAKAGTPKSRDGAVEAIRVLLVAKRSARQSRVKALVQMRHIVYTAPDQLRSTLKGLGVTRLVLVASGLRSASSSDPVTAATKASLSSLARRVRAIDAEIARLDAMLRPLVAATAPELLELVGVGLDSAATLLVTAGDNPRRLVSEAGWAHLCGVSPIQASSGKVTRHRLDRGGDRNANAALWRVVMVRLTCDADTKAYVERRSKEGLSKREIIRILKRYVAREVYRHLPRA
jgi:transposase